jgi:hypothetical protein
MRRTEMMRLSAVVALGAILAHTFVFANYTIVHRRTFNLNATFAGAEAIGDVAFDGNNLYVSSWHNAAGTQTVRLVQVGDIRHAARHPQRRAHACRVDGHSERSRRLARHAAGLLQQSPLLGVGLGATLQTQASAGTTYTGSCR